MRLFLPLFVYLRGKEKRDQRTSKSLRIFLWRMVVKAFGFGIRPGF